MDKKSWFGKSNKSASALLENDWRSIKWGEEDKIRKDLKEMKVRNPEVQHLRILVHGPVGAGKSSFINSIDSIFQERMTSKAIAQTATERSCTKIFKVHGIRDGKTREFLPFSLCDIMGLEKGPTEGLHPDDLIKILKGQIKDGHKFNPVSSCSETEENFVSRPTLSEEIHCLLSVIPADVIGLMKDEDFTKMRQIKDQANDMGIPQLAMLTKVELACPEVLKDLKVVYKSKKIKEKMQECSNSLGVPMNCIFPVKNYHEEIDLNTDVNALLLSALTRILDFANDYVEDKKPPAPANRKSSSDEQHKSRLYPDLTH
ncbi:interferon-induced protein 44-like [Sardina pilchardus]|uniref:interferon-induced protein 44-like n=1 Tax=Sardina pilchardus TaxID=27697 RepID=UPI002E101938